MTSDRYDELRAAAEAATPGPWVAYNRAGEGAPDDDFLGWDFEEFNGPPEPGRGVLRGRDMRFVVLARRDVLAILSERERLLAAEARRVMLEEFYQADQAVRTHGRLNSTPEQDERLDRARAALTTKEGRT